MNVLLVAYFFPPCRDIGAGRPAAMARYLERLGHGVTVLTTRAYGELPDDAEHGVHRAPDLQLARARLRGERTIGSLYAADTYSGRPHPLSRVLVPEPLVAAWMPFARALAMRPSRSPATARRSPPGSSSSAPARCRLKSASPSPAPSRLRASRFSAPFRMSERSRFSARRMRSR